MSDIWQHFLLGELRHVGEFRQKPEGDSRWTRSCCVFDDRRVERSIDLDQAAAEVAARRHRWTAGGLVAGPLTWRDEVAVWPQQLEQDRSRVQDPDSVGIRITGPSDSELSVVLFRGGWADADFLGALADVVVSEAPDVGSPSAFGELLDAYVFRAFGLSSSGASSAS